VRRRYADDEADDGDDESSYEKFVDQDKYNGVGVDDERDEMSLA
jgi:hypothetical protein